MRARFVGPDGVSFFDEIECDGPWVQRYKPTEITFEAHADPYSHPLRVEIETYVRERWYVPCGPIACQMPPGRFSHPDDDQIDVVYRFDGES